MASYDWMSSCFWTIHKIPILGCFKVNPKTTERNILVPIDMQRKNLRSVNIALRMPVFFFFGGWKENREAMFAFRDTRCGTKKGGHVSIDRFPLPTPSGIRKRGLLRLAFPRLEIFFRDRMIMQNRGRLMCCEGNWKYDRYDRLSLFGPKLKILQDLIYVKSKLGRKRFQHEIWLFGFLVQEIYPRRFQG